MPMTLIAVSRPVAAALERLLRKSSPGRNVARALEEFFALLRSPAN
jgi:hypothetical protein